MSVDKSAERNVSLEAVNWPCRHKPVTESIRRENVQENKQDVQQDVQHVPPNTPVSSGRMSPIWQSSCHKQQDLRPKECRSSRITTPDESSTETDESQSLADLDWPITKHYVPPKIIPPLNYYVDHVKWPYRHPEPKTDAETQWPDNLIEIREPPCRQPPIAGCTFPPQCGKAIEEKPVVASQSRAMPMPARCCDAVRTFPPECGNFFDS